MVKKQVSAKKNNQCPETCDFMDVKFVNYNPDDWYFYCKKYRATIDVQSISGKDVFVKIKNCAMEMPSPIQGKLKGKFKKMELLADMARTRALLRLIWQQYDLNGESSGCSFRCKALELAMDLLDRYFERDAQLHERMDRDPQEAVNEIADVVNGYRHEETVKKIQNDC
jgi:hypothetical protein